MFPLLSHLRAHYRHLHCRHLHCRHLYYTRAPIIGVLGHVDHGKTTLIDTLRQTKNVLFEAGGITQKNSIFQHVIPENNFKFTIVDTPGHAAFYKMRSHGATIADIAILVVAATEGVKPQTIECIEILKQNKLPIIVALNKTDLSRSNIDKCVEQLFEYGIEAEQIGGDIKAIPISALHGINILELMTSVKAVADKLDLTTDITVDPAQAIVFDTFFYKRCSYTTVLVKEGILRKRGIVVSENNYSKASIRSLTLVDGTSVDEALPGMPVVIQGHNSRTLPEVGSTLISCRGTHRSISIQSATHYIRAKRAMLGMADNIVTGWNIADKLKRKISYLICADTSGSVDIIRDMLSVNTDDVILSVFSTTIAGISEDKLLMAEGMGAQLVLFNVAPLHRPTTSQIHHFDIIYDLAASIERYLNECLPPVYIQKVIGSGYIAQLHGTSKERICGVNHLYGEFHRNAKFRITRNEIVVWEGLIRSLKYLNESLETITGRSECGVAFPKFSNVTADLGDKIYCYIEAQKGYKLLDRSYFGGDKSFHSG